MATVYLAHDDVLGRDVAVKILARRLAEHGESVERFRREARNAASLSHPNIVAVHDSGRTDEGDRYIIMEYVPGCTLKELLDRRGPLPPAEAVSVALQVARALAAAHARGVIHRDVKPQNVLLTESGEAKVADFGIARAAGSATLTETGPGPGTARYVSPEQAEGKPVTPQSDLYSLGVVLYEMLTGRVPFDDESPISVAIKHITEAPQPPKELDRSIPQRLNDLILRLLGKEPPDRPADAAMLVEELEGIHREIAGSAATRAAAPAFSLDRPPRPDKRARTVPPPPPRRAARAAASRERGRRRAGFLSWLAAGAVAVVGVLAVLLVSGYGATSLAGLGPVAGLPGGEDGGEKKDAPLSEAPGQPRNSPDSGDPGGTTSGPAPGYNAIKDPTGSLSLEVPADWTVLTGRGSENPGGQVENWSTWAGGEISSSITTTPSLVDWHNAASPVSGTYAVASRALAQTYTDSELIYSTLYAGQADNCERGPAENFRRSALSGQMQTWQDCRGLGITNFIVVAYPEGRECVAVLQARLVREADREAIQHILDTFGIDCTRIED